MPHLDTHPSRRLAAPGRGATPRATPPAWGKRRANRNSRNGCNKAALAQEKLSYDGIDNLVEALRIGAKRLGSNMELWKADIDSAYRRIPVHMRHRQYTWVVWLDNGKLMMARHLVLPFGASASVYHWDRIGALIATLARKLLHLPVLRWVDDLYSFERSGHAEHAAKLFKRLTEAVLGK